MTRIILSLTILFSSFLFAQGNLFNTGFWQAATTSSNPPTTLSLTHSTRNRGFTVSWTAGSGNNGAGGCKLQYFRNGTTWTDLASTYNCDSTTTNAAANLPSGDNWTNNFNGTGVQVRLVRISDSTAMGTFTQRTTCTTTSGSSSSTPTIDEDCDARWNNTTSEPAYTTASCWTGTISGTYNYNGSYTASHPSCYPGASNFSSFNIYCSFWTAEMSRENFWGNSTCTGMPNSGTSGSCSRGTATLSNTLTVTVPNSTGVCHDSTWSIDWSIGAPQCHHHIYGGSFKRLNNLANFVGVRCSFTYYGVPNGSTTTYF